MLITLIYVRRSKTLWVPLSPKQGILDCMKVDKVNWIISMPVLFAVFNDGCNVTSYLKPLPPGLPATKDYNWRLHMKTNPSLLSCFRRVFCPSNRKETRTVLILIFFFIRTWCLTSYLICQHWICNALVGFQIWVWIRL